MAGAGYKLFATGDVLTAAQVNTYLMQQTVMVFASSAARTSALSGVLAEGMVSYLQDTNTLEVYDGAAWIGATGDITGLTAGTGISISSATGPVPTVAIDTAVTADLTTAQTLTNKTLTSPVLTTPSISNINAKGDILVGTADNTLGIITAGSNGETLVADSSTSTGLRYTAGNAQGNPVLNSAFQVWQRGTTSTSSGGYFTADRWYQFRGAATGSWSQVTTGLPTGFQYAIKVQRTAGQTSGDGLGVNQVFESINSIPFAGKTVTLSFYAKAGANYSPTSSALAVRGYTGTGTDQAAGNFGGWTGYAEPISGSATLTTSWQRFTFTGTFASTATQFGMVFYLFGQGTAGADDSYQITGVQLDVGSVALPFRTFSATLQGELAACQRYYYRQTGNADNGYAAGFAPSTTSAIFCWQLPVSMRIAPTSIEVPSTITNLKLTNWDSVSYTISTLAIASGTASGTNSVNIRAVSSGLTTNQGVLLANNATVNGFIGVSAEL
jgi:hypothetical protein